MLLAEALMKKQELRKNIKGLQNEILRNNVVVEGEELDVDIQPIVNNLGKALEGLGNVSIAIERTNHLTVVEPPSGFSAVDLSLVKEQVFTLADLLVFRRFMDENIAVIKSLYDASGKAGMGGYALPDVKRVNLLTRDVFRESYSNLCEERRKLEIQIQSLNWKTELQSGV